MLDENYRPRDLIHSCFNFFSESNTVEVQVEGKDPGYVRSQLLRRIDARYLGDIIEAEVVDRSLYLSK